MTPLPPVHIHLHFDGPSSSNKCEGKLNAPLLEITYPLLFAPKTAFFITVCLSIIIIKLFESVFVYFSKEIINPTIVMECML